MGWEDPLEKEMATHSRILAWGIPWTEEPGMGSLRVGYNLVTKLNYLDILQSFNTYSPSR